MSDRLGARMQVLAGFAVSASSLALLSLMAQDTLRHVVLLCAFLAVTGKTYFVLAVPASCCSRILSVVVLRINIG